jgi:hypothetical protein
MACGEVFSETAPVREIVTIGAAGNYTAGNYNLV